LLGGFNQYRAGLDYVPRLWIRKSHMVHVVHLLGLQVSVAALKLTGREK
jgi:hypothetical protein